MAVAERSAEDVCIERLNRLLQRAYNVKPSTTVHRQLQVSPLISEEESELIPLKPFATQKEENAAKETRNLVIESAAKRILYGLLGSTRITDPGFVSVWNLLDIIQYYGDRELCAIQLVLVLIEELLDGLSLTECRTVLTFLESRRETLIATKSGKNKDLVILRLCNELLRRQSRAEDPVFCGRVYIFLFQSFPLGDKSSVNLRGQFHVENVTTFEEYLATTTPAEDEMAIDPKEDVSEELQGGTEAKATVTEPPTDKPATMDIDKLYPVFWSLQHSFSDPPRLFEEENFKQFREGLEATLAKFKEVPKVAQAIDPSRGTDAQELSGSESGAASASNPKYLTSRDLFNLELSDLAFQRHILVQALIMIEFLLTLTEKSKSKPYYQEAQARMQYDFTLSEENYAIMMILDLPADLSAQTEWALGIKNSIANYLQDGPDGKFYYRMVDTVLSRDKNWVRWKMRSCKSFTRPRVSAANYIESKSGAQRAGIQKKLLGPTKATASLQFLSGDEKGLSQLRHKNRFAKPSVQEHVDKVRMADADIELTDMGNDDEGVQDYLDKKTSHTWRALRLASIDQLKSFDGIEHGKGIEKLVHVTSSSEAADNNTPIAPEDKDAVPEGEHPSVEERRAG